MLVAFVILIFAALIPAAIAQSKGRNFFLWWIYGAAFFIVALPHALFMTPDQGRLDAKQLNHGQRKCPHCAELIREEANVCRFCGRDLQPSVTIAAPVDGLQPVANSVSSEDIQKVIDEEVAQMDPNQGALLAAFLFVVFALVFWVAFVAARSNSTNEASYVSPSTGRGALVTSPSVVATPLARPQPPHVPEVEVGGTGCAVLNRHGFVTFMICPQATSSGMLRRAARAACEGKSVCNVWIWDEQRYAAQSLPMTDAQTNAAVAVWINRAEELTLCRRDGC